MISYVVDYIHYVLHQAYLSLSCICVRLKHMMEFYEKAELAGLNIMNIWELHWSSEVLWSNRKKIKHFIKNNSTVTDAPGDDNVFYSDELNTGP